MKKIFLISLMLLFSIGILYGQAYVGFGGSWIKDSTSFQVFNKGLKVRGDVWAEDAFFYGLVRVQNSFGTDTFRVDSDGLLNIGGGNDVYLGNSDYGYKRSLYLANLDASVGTFSDNVNSNDVFVDDTLWSKGVILLDTNKQGAIYYTGWDMYIKNKKTSGYIKIVGEGTNKGVIIDASGEGGSQAYWIGNGVSSFSWTKTSGATSLPIAVLDSNQFYFGNTNGMVRMSVIPATNSVHYGFVGDQDAGMYRFGADSIGFFSNGQPSLIVANKTVHSLLPFFVDDHARFKELSSSPTPDVDENEVQMYMKADKLVVAWKHSITGVKYWYLDFTSEVDQMWTFTTTPP